MRFGNPENFRLLFIVVPLLLFFFYKVYVIIRNLNTFYDKKTAAKMAYAVSPALAVVKYLVLAAAFVFFIIAVARPWGKPVKSEMELSGIDIMVAVDVSSSMAAMDLKPDRMEVVKQGLKDFSMSLSGDRVGMITFAGTDFVQCPLTVDYDAYDLIIDSLYPGMLFKDGTALGNAIKSCADRMVEKAGKSRIMILITDGESNAGIPPVEAARYAKDKDIRIYSIGVGTKEGAKIPGGADVFGRRYYKTYEGQEVISKLDDSELREVSGITGGKFYRVTDLNAFKSIKNDIRFMEENKSKKEEIKHEENYAGYLLIGLILFVLSQALTIRDLKTFSFKGMLEGRKSKF